ncbi:hypothetical protein B5X24_HaOG217274 [Helicoverpa armigera]|uniref:Uncharacterized protein n=1 Tax=Helicoverpa armigera TaxID=29058 RepID=A0A2W1BYN8_HELAM|nr:hypothetical protein B5X24_HaOG217274 [Helicoverpa armigera]
MLYFWKALGVCLLSIITECKYYFDLKHNTLSIVQAISSVHTVPLRRPSTISQAITLTHPLRNINTLQINGASPLPATTLSGVVSGASKPQWMALSISAPPSTDASP